MARAENGNIILDENFKQVCVWPGTLLKDSEVNDFVEFFKEELDARVQFLEVILTAPDKNKFGEEVAGTGGRSDVFFAIHRDDVGKFAVPRLAYGIRWIEDVYSNGGGPLYEDRVAAYKTW